MGSKMRLIIVLVCIGLATANAEAQRVEADWIAKDFSFATGEKLAELRIHYVTLGNPRNPAVLMLHGTTGSGTGLVGPMSPLFAPGDLLDTTKHYVIFPDGIGHGRSSKPS